MSDSECTDNNSKQHEDLKSSAKKIVSDGQKIQANIKELVLDVLRAGRLGFDQLSKVSGQILEGAANGLRNVAPEERDKRLREAFNGLEEAYQSALQAASLALQEADQRGTKFSEEDLKHTLGDLQALEKLFMETVERFAKSTSDQAAQQLSDVETHAKRLFENIRPSLSKAISSAKNQPVETAKEATGIFARALAGALDAASDAIKPKSK